MFIPRRIACSTSAGVAPAPHCVMHMTPDGRFQAGADADADLDQRQGLGIERSGILHRPGNALVGPPEGGNLFTNSLYVPGELLGSTLSRSVSLRSATLPSWS